MADIAFLTAMPAFRSVDQWTADLRRIEAAGFHGVTVSEHFTPGWRMDALTAANHALALTERLHAWTLVLINDLHNPVVLARAASMTASLTRGRFVLGLGAGWLPEDYSAVGVRQESPGRRIDRLEDSLRRIAGELDGCEPRPPVLVGGGGPRLLAVAGAGADVVSIQARRHTGPLDDAAAEEYQRDGIEHKVRRVEAAAAAAGRPRPRLQFTCLDVVVDGRRVTAGREGFTEYFDAQPERFAGSPGSLRGEAAHVADLVEQYAEELGITYWHLGSDLPALAPVVQRLSRT